MSLDMFSLEGKTALITGASRGIGAGIATAFAAAGADVALAARSTADIEALAGKLAADGRKAIAITTDVTDRAQIESCVARAIDELGHIDILVNNAGGTAFMAPITTLRFDGWQKAIALNLDSVFHFMQLVGAHMVERNEGSVINISSVAGVAASPMLSYYSAAKHAVIGLSKTAAAEWGHANVRVNSICPGWVKTDLNKQLWEDPERAADWVKNQPIKRWGEVEDITGAALWLASPAGRFVTAASIIIDGGATGGRSIA